MSSATAHHAGLERSRLVRLVLKLAGFTILWGAVLFLSAGRLDWPRGWIYLGLCVLGLVVNGAGVIRKNPELVRERWKKRADTKTFDKVFMVLYTPTVFVMPAVAGLDAVRFGWSSMGPETLYIGVALHLVSILPIAAAMATNPFLETTVRIQTDRGHRVITTGPYRVVRHPMYVGAILHFLGTPLVLGSVWTSVPVGTAILMFVVRAALEDRTLRRELPGYEEYAQRTRWRLLPGVW
jgi:protein-S-isoprenylcysteine O-methyltransferase Ste14